MGKAHTGQDAESRSDQSDHQRFGQHQLHHLAAAGSDGSHHGEFPGALRDDDAERVLNDEGADEHCHRRESQ